MKHQTIIEQLGKALSGPAKSTRRPANGRQCPVPSVGTGRSHHVYPVHSAGWPGASRRRSTPNHLLSAPRPDASRQTSRAKSQTSRRSPEFPLPPPRRTDRGGTVTRHLALSPCQSPDQAGTAGQTAVPDGRHVRAPRGDIERQPEAVE